MAFLLGDKRTGLFSFDRKNTHRFITVQSQYFWIDTQGTNFFFTVHCWRTKSELDSMDLIIWGLFFSFGKKLLWQVKNHPKRGRDQIIVSITHPTISRRLIRIKRFLSSRDLMQEIRSAYVLEQLPVHRGQTTTIPSADMAQMTFTKV